MSDLNILYVEDFPVIQKMYLEVLTKEGFSVDVASDGTEALWKTVDKEYDLILLDLLLPRMSGLEFLRKYRERNGTAKVIVLTDFDDPKTMEEISALNIDDYWMKVENTPHDLADKIKKVMGAPTLETEE